MDRKLSRLPIKLIVWTVFCLSGQQVDQTYNRKTFENPRVITLSLNSKLKVEKDFELLIKKIIHLTGAATNP